MTGFEISISMSGIPFSLTVTASKRWSNQILKFQGGSENSENPGRVSLLKSRKQEYSCQFCYLETRILLAAPCDTNKDNYTSD